MRAHLVDWYYQGATLALFLVALPALWLFFRNERKEYECARF